MCHECQTSKETVHETSYLQVTLLYTLDPFPPYLIFASLCEQGLDLTNPIHGKHVIKYIMKM